MNYGEGFCHMQYYGKNKIVTISCSIWNSRDGVTPFSFHCEQFGLMLNHVNYHLDRIDVNYKPKKGDLIWRTMTDEDYTRLEKKSYDRYCSLYGKEKAKEHPDPKCLELYARVAEGTLEEWAEMGRSSRQEGEPILKLVEEDWV